MRRSPRILAFALLASAVTATPARSQQPAPAALVEAARAIGDDIAAVRGLDWRGSVDFRVSDRETIRRFATESLERQMPPREWATQSALLQHCGLLPAGVDLKELVVRLYTEQVAGYYDPQVKTFYLADWLPQLLQTAVVAHEITHALQDQHFDLATWLGEASPADDTSLARVSVTEGDAMAAMLAYLLIPAGVSIDQLPDPATLLQGESQAIAQAYPTFDQAPRALQRILLFPYVEGTGFVLAALREGGWRSVDALYVDPPTSTEQILHPSLYWENRDEPRPVAAPRRRDGSEVLTEGSWGEFGTGLILEAALGEPAAESASGWDGDRYALYRRTDGSLAYDWTLVWDTPQDARRFARSYAQATVTRFSESAHITTAEDRFVFEGPERRLDMRWTGDRVEIHESHTR